MEVETNQSRTNGSAVSSFPSTSSYNFKSKRRLLLACNPRRQGTTDRQSEEQNSPVKNTRATATRVLLPANDVCDVYKAILLVIPAAGAAALWALYPNYYSGSLQLIDALLEREEGGDEGELNYFSISMTLISFLPLWAKQGNQSSQSASSPIIQSANWLNIR